MARSRLNVGLTILSFALLAAFTPHGAQAQGARPAPLEIQLAGYTQNSSWTGDGPTIRADGVLSGKKIRELMLNAFPARLRFRVELWDAAGFSNRLVDSTTWSVGVRYDPATQHYTVQRVHGDVTETLGTFPSVDEAEAAASRPYTPHMGPLQRGRRYYFTAMLEVQALEISDLDALQRWLRGEFQPAIRGKRSPLAAIREGLGTLVSRILGGDRQTHTQRSAVFVAA
jgi:hypothetical protein